MVPQYVVCTLILIEHNKGVVCMCLYGYCKNCSLGGEQSTIWRSFSISGFEIDAMEIDRCIHFNICFSSVQLC